MLLRPDRFPSTTAKRMPTHKPGGQQNHARPSGCDTHVYNKAKLVECVGAGSLKEAATNLMREAYYSSIPAQVHICTWCQSPQTNRWRKGRTYPSCPFLHTLAFACIRLLLYRENSAEPAIATVRELALLNTFGGVGCIPGNVHEIEDTHVCRHPSRL